MEKIVRSKGAAVALGLSFGLIGGLAGLAISRLIADEGPSVARFDVVIESGDAGRSGHPCTTDPSRNCFTFKFERK